MSFSFRNIFSPEEGDGEGGVSGRPLYGQEGADRSGSGSSTGGVEVAYQSFLASELLAFIPPAISARSGIPMEKELHVPFHPGSHRDVRLSTLYQLCPELFAAEITPLNDSVVTLPPRLGFSPPAATTAVADHGLLRPAVSRSNGLAAVENGAGSPGNNPFWSPVSAVEPKTESGKSTLMKKETPLPRGNHSSTSPVGQKGAGENPFSVPGQQGGNPFSPAGPAAVPVTSGPKIAGGFDGPPFSAPPVGSGSGGFSGGFQAFEAGSPSVSPKGGSEEVKSKAVENGTGFTDNPFESSHGFTTLFSKGAAADAAIPFPSAPFPEEKQEETPGAWGTMFQSAAAVPPEVRTDSVSPSTLSPSIEGFGSMITKSTEARESSPWGNVSAPISGDSPFEAVPESLDPILESSPEPAFGAGKAVEPAVFEPLSADPPPVASTPAPEVIWTMEPTTPKPSPAPAAEISPVPPAPNGDVFVPKEPSAFTSVRGQTGPVRSQSAPERVDEAPVAAPVVPANQIFDLKDLELKAIFSTSESFTLSKLARRIVGLPGISSCALSTPGKLVQASRTEESRIGNEAREMVTTLRNLAKLTGLPEARTFTLHTDRGIVSLFLEEECCVTVHHDSATFQPGVREKLILVARNLITLEE